MDYVLNPGIWLLAVLVLSLIGMAANFGLYELGKQGRCAVEERFPSVSQEHWQRLEGLYQRYGSWALLLSGLPLLGPLVSSAAGVFSVKLRTFIMLVLVAQLVRNALIVMAAVGTYSLVTG